MRNIKNHFFYLRPEIILRDVNFHLLTIKLLDSAINWINAFHVKLIWIECDTEWIKKENDIFTTST